MKNVPDETIRSKPSAKRTMTGDGWYSPKNNENQGPPEEIGGYVTLGIPDYIKLASNHLNGDTSLLDQQVNIFQNPTITRAIETRTPIILASHDSEEKLTLTNIPVKLYALRFDVGKGTFEFKAVRDMVANPVVARESTTQPAPAGETPAIRQRLTAIMVAAVLGAAGGFALGKGCDNNTAAQNSKETSVLTSSE